VECKSLAQSSEFRKPEQKEACRCRPALLLPSTSTWLQIYRGIYESGTLPLPPPPLLPFPSRLATDRPNARRPALLPANGGRAGEPGGVVDAGTGVTAAALGGGAASGAAVALAPAAARLAVARGPQAPAGAHVPGGVRTAAAPALRALPRRPRRHPRRAPGAALRHGPRRVRLQGPSGGTPPILLPRAPCIYLYRSRWTDRLIDRSVQPFSARDRCKWCKRQKGVECLSNCWI
jgi:hypothetical protein